MPMLLVWGRHKMWFSSVSSLTRQQWSWEERIQVHLWLSGEWEKYLSIILGEVRQCLQSIHSCVIFWAVSTQQKLTHAEAPTEWKATLLRHKGLFLSSLSLFSYLFPGFSRFGSVKWTMFTVSHSFPILSTPHHQSAGQWDTLHCPQTLYLWLICWLQFTRPSQTSGSAMISCESVKYRNSGHVPLDFRRREPGSILTPEAASSSGSV